ncbi:MAG: RimK family protein [Deltaproteobacteria bacterium]|nr:RimK family protein [Deltaproteobacteria bacterium]
MNIYLVTSNPKDWKEVLPDVQVISARDYLTNPDYNNSNKVRVFNLSKSYKYQSMGYYVSLLAEARGHKVLPSITTVQDVKSQTLVKLITSDLDELIQQSFRRLQSSVFDLSIYFGRNLAKQYDNLARQLFNLFPAPMLRAHFFRKSEKEPWEIRTIEAISFNEVPEHHKEFFMAQAVEYFSRRSIKFAEKKHPKYDLAILYNPADESPPSNKAFFDKFKKVAKQKKMRVDLISKEDMGHLGEYDALFIRETTNVNHYTYRLARRAHADGLAVIDDPLSISRCSNKVYLAELLKRHGVSIPRTLVIHSENVGEVSSYLGTPCILKKPDGAFSLGVTKVSSESELTEKIKEFLQKSELIIGQEFIPTDFDWRVGVLDGEPLYACRYYMAKGHWQICDWQKSGKSRFGKVESVPLWEVPRSVVQSALSATQLIGQGLYGVDLKQVGDQVYVIEVNDNPDLEAGCEDASVGEELYEKLIDYFIRKIEQRRGNLGMPS